MLNVINQIIKVLQIPYFVLAIILCVYLVYSRKRLRHALILVIVFMVLWRLCFRITSSRYCASFIIVLPLLAAETSKGIKKDSVYLKKITYTVCLALIGFNSIKLFSGFRDSYLHDLRADIKDIILKNSNVDVYIPQKDKNRINFKDINPNNTQNIITVSTISHDTLQDFYDEVLYVNDSTKDSYYVVSQKGNLDLPEGIKSKNYSFKEIRHYRSNNKKSFYSIYKQDRIYPPLLKNDAIDTPRIADIIKNGVLKVYEPSCDTYVFQVQNKIIWVIRKPVEDKTSVVFHLYTDQRDLLPEKRRQFSFDNRDFRIRNVNNSQITDNYLVFERNLPTEYPIKKIEVGFSRNGKRIWRKYFQVSDF